MSSITKSSSYLVHTESCSSVLTYFFTSEATCDFVNTATYRMCNTIIIIIVINISIHHQTDCRLNRVVHGGVEPDHQSLP